MMYLGRPTMDRDLPESRTLDSHEPRPLFLIFVFILLAACFIGPSLSFAYQSRPAPKASSDPRFPEFTGYEVNGAKVYLKREPDVQKAAISALMMAGIGNELPGETNCAHMAEHMAIILPMGDRPSVSSVVGGIYAEGEFNVNGLTSLDSTGYIISVENPDVPHVVSLFLDALFRPDIRANDDFVAEIKRARRELDTITTTLPAALTHRLRVNAFAGTPYSENIFEVPLKTITPELIQGFMEREYSPNRLTLFVISDVADEVILSTIEDALSGIEAGQPPVNRIVELAAPPSPFVSGMTGPIADSEAFELPEISEPVIGIAIGIDDVLPEDRIAVTMMIEALAQSLNRQDRAEGFRLEPVYRSLSITHNTALVGLIYLPPPRTADINKAALAVPRIVEIVRGAIEAIITGGFTEKDLKELPLPGSDDVPAIVFTDASNRAMGAVLTLSLTSDMDPYEAADQVMSENLVELGELDRLAAKYLVDATITAVMTSEKQTPGWAIAAFVVAIAAIMVLVVSRWNTGA